MKTISENRAFGGVQGVYTHASQITGCDMTFGLFLPEQAEEGAVPVLWYLSGLTCTHENAMVKAGAQRWAAEAGIAMVFPDTSPRGEGVANHADYDLGQGAGFYVNATQAPWAPHFQMWDYITDELPNALFSYLGADETAWAPHDATLLMKKRGFDGPMLIDQGTADQFLDLLKPEALATAMVERRQGGAFRMQKGYDHSYFFVSTFIEEHVAFHAAALHA
jgi:S-formylglutathione hydrolase